MARVYDWMLPPYLERLRALEAVCFGRHRPLLTALIPTALCGACSTEAQAVDSRLSRLKTAASDQEVQIAIGCSTAVCVDHFLAIAPPLTWPQLRLASQALLAELEHSQASAEEGRLLERLKGADAEASLRRPADTATPGLTSRSMAGAGSPGGWSPTLEELQLLLRRGGCPVCQGSRQGPRDYSDWLAHEICTQPRSRWEDAMWLCRVHTWDFAAGWDGPSQAALSRATAGYCQDQLHGLVEELAQEPSANLMVRLAGSRGAGRQIWAALASAFEPPSSRLAGLRQRCLRRRECPACRARNSARQRLAELIALAMSDPATRDAYEHSAGLCYRHLPLACGAARDQEQLRALSSTARSQLEILQWELDEVLRKESWSVRYEPRRGEVSAWRRAAAQVSGLLGREHAAWAMTGVFSSRHASRR